MVSTPGFSYTCTTNILSAAYYGQQQWSPQQALVQQTDAVQQEVKNHAPRKASYSFKKPPESWKADWRTLCRICGWGKDMHGKNFGPGKCLIDLCNYCEKNKTLHILES